MKLLVNQSQPNLQSDEKEDTTEQL